MTGTVYGESNWDAKPGAILSQTWSHILIKIKQKSFFDEYYRAKFKKF